MINCKHKRKCKIKKREEKTTTTTATSTRTLSTRTLLNSGPPELSDALSYLGSIANLCPYI